jgi:hypothetical protein
MPVNTKMNLMSSYLLILSVHIWLPLIDVGVIPEQVVELPDVYGSCAGTDHNILEAH